IVAMISPTDASTLFRNLLDNAVKYAGTPPVVRIQVDRDGELTVVRIIDNGPGIPKERRRRIFLRFVRGDNELERVKPGTGLGLSIVRALVKRWRGTIRIADSPPGYGACFEVRLPLAECD
ncbi:MAG: ATP-binding protein, partial [Planctomycetia bacterium]|nr:ATP-binding protein [Planctomycetia bacterium]